jgi:hypothetical protein
VLYVQIFGVLLLLAGIGWWAAVLGWFSSSPQKPPAPAGPDIHEVVDAYRLLYGAVPKDAKAALHEKVWPAINGGGR